MQRRTLLTLGLGSAAALSVAGWGARAWAPGWQGSRLSEPARALFAAVARAVLEGVLPTDPAVRELALRAHVDRVEQAIQGLAPATRGELSDLLAVLGLAPGRWALAGLAMPWEQASTGELAQALQAMRVSGSQTRRQVYQALRDLTNAGWFADAGTWGALGYPGPHRL